MTIKQLINQISVPQFDIVYERPSDFWKACCDASIDISRIVNDAYLEGKDYDYIFFNYIKFNYKLEHLSALEDKYKDFNRDIFYSVLEVYKIEAAGDNTTKVNFLVRYNK